MSSALKNGLPIFLTGNVVKGFGRGSKQLGIPTANYADIVIELLPRSIPCGIYYGWANVDNGPVYKMVMSIGWNPFYENKRKSIETHILHNFDQDFYGSCLKTAILGYIRPEKNFSSVDDLVEAIKGDIKVAEEQLDCPECRDIQSHIFFKKVDSVSN